MTSIAPLSVAGLIEFQVFDTEPEIDRTYCMALPWKQQSPQLRYSRLSATAEVRTVLEDIST